MQNSPQTCGAVSKAQGVQSALAERKTLTAHKKQQETGPSDCKKTLMSYIHYVNKPLLEMEQERGRGTQLQK